MADWRQIQARIRKAKNSLDAQAKLTELFQRTRDAMVAWELGVIEEKAARNEEAVRWYTIAAERFRRAEWKKKAEEALERLGIALPVRSTEAGADESGVLASESHETAPPLAVGEIPDEAGIAPQAEPRAAVSGSVETEEGGKKKRRRGRRGGRGRRRKGGAAAPGLPTEAFAKPAEAPPQPQPRAQVSRPDQYERPAIAPPEPARAARVEHASPQLPSERTAHGRAGDPALASRMAHLESMLRRLLSGTLHRLDESDEAPAGPGVFLLSDSDQVTSYYIEACQTLRVGIGNLVRGGRSGKSIRGGRGFSDSALKAKLAEHLGIGEAKVAQYMKDHCVIRWIQMDDDAPHLAHFAIGVLRTPLNID